MGVVLFNSVRAGRWGYTVGRKGMAYLQIEGYASDKVDQSHNSYQRNTYKGIRLVADDYSLYYSVL
jgi:hypothetical protein